MSVKKFLLMLVCLLFCYGHATPQHVRSAESLAHGQVELTVVETANRKPLVAALVVLQMEQNHKYSYTGITDDRGMCFFRKIPQGSYKAHIRYQGSVYHASVLANSEHTRLSLPVHIAPVKLQEVVVTATPARGKTSASKIGQKAMSHLQPSGFGDLLELLPGGRSYDPNFTGVNTIRLREADDAPERNYTTGSLGIAFVVDGVPINTDADQLYSPGVRVHFSGVSNAINRGVDLRTISTDDIEEVEIVRGIPSVEYGELTSGLVKIKRKMGAGKLEARFKADLYSKLFYTGKGFEWGKQDKLTLNLGVNYLDSKASPTNTRFNYSRLGTVLRLNKIWQSGSPYVFTAGTSLDYTSTVNKNRYDKNIDKVGNVLFEKYRMDYNRIAWQNHFSISPKNRKNFFRGLNVQAALTGEFSEFDHWRHVTSVPGEPIMVPYLGEGVYFVRTLTAQDATFDATLRNESNPLYAYANAIATFGMDRTQWLSNRIRVGADWRMSKNYGRGVLFDPQNPIDITMDLVARPYREIPAYHTLATFVEDNLSLRFAGFRFGLEAGLRLSSMLGFDKRYKIHGKVFADPRINAQLEFPVLSLAGHNLRFDLAGGYGRHTKMPTMEHLSPEPLYDCHIMYNYYGSNRALMETYKINPTNFDLMPAHNDKWEIRADASWRDYFATATYFREDMKDAFRILPRYYTIKNRQFDNMPGDKIEDIPFKEFSRRSTYGYYENGSRIAKRGLEFVFATPRYPVINTKLTATGAYFHNRYENSSFFYDVPRDDIGHHGSSYVGVYHQNDLYVFEQFRTNFMLDTQFPSLGLICSSNFQIEWFSGKKINMPHERPDYYVDYSGQWKPFPADVNTVTDPNVKLELQRLIREKRMERPYERTPFNMRINLKLSKEFLDKRMMVSFFVNRMLTIYKEREKQSEKDVIMRIPRPTPYFGMEINFKL